ncbi:probable E3 ubiquitin-protein ligase ZFP1 [Chenopodium quinoa]|uniref:probable E3 ubiquitin-protein ligase ZFP1 n=1 Tax=Chenopodium quinoa TaxID=63459 RepID=UPI000B78C317|nr:probable E3 ubiquitin-protein ligase ZFP1 [Chenopodium quinoa]XP_021730610.1 probable E3 ubiquitin-protein ligase ZFP1 [Chenopodium quinoa]
MAHRHIYNTSQIFEADADQPWNLTEDPYLHFARPSSAENAPIFHPMENGPVDRVHYVSPWNPATRLSGYSSSSQMVNAPHYQPDSSDPSRDSMHPSAGGNAFMVPENHVHHASSSNYGVENNFFDLSMSNGRGPYKRKSPGIPSMTERGSSSRYYCAGSSSDVSSSSDLRQEKSTVDAQHNHWESLAVPASYRTNQLSIGNETSMRNVRSRSTLDLESDVYRTHLPTNYPHHPSSSRLPIDHPGIVDSNPNPSVPLPEWTPIHVSGAPHGRTISNLSHESNHFFPGSSIANSSGDMPGYHHEHIASRNSLSQNLHPTPSHTRGVRSSYSHRSTPNGRVSMGNMRVSHVAPPDEGLQLPGEAHSARHPRQFGPVGWRNGDRSGRSRLSSERYRLLSEDAGVHDRLTPEGLMVVDRSSLYGSRSFLDQHRDMRLDVDNMSYEELLALGERIGSVNTGLHEDQLPKCVTETVYCSSDQVQEEGRCVICLEEYRHMDDVGTLKACGHDYHVSCIKKWLSMKNACPICKGPALPENTADK